MFISFSLAYFSEKAGAMAPHVDNRPDTFAKSMVPAFVALFCFFCCIRVDAIMKAFHWNAGNNFTVTERMMAQMTMALLVACGYPLLYVTGAHSRKALIKFLFMNPAYQARFVGQDFGLDHKGAITFLSGGRRSIALFVPHPQVITLLEQRQ
jgi:hypothetical protein